MKSILLFVFSAFFVFVLLQFSVQSAHASCMTITGSVSLNSGQWPQGAGGLQLACAGDNPQGNSHCGGSSQTVMPGQSFTFSNCSCLAGPCLSIANASVPPGCTFESSVNFCGQNGDTVQAPIKLNCPAPPTPCAGGAGYCGDANGSFATSCPYGAEPTSWNDTGDNWCGSSTYNPNNSQAGHCFTKCKPAPPAAPKCGDSCAGNPNLCQNISGCNYCNPSTNKCEAPPACGANCAGNPNICQNIVGCNYCNPANNTCAAPPVTNPPVTNPPVTNPPVTNPPNPTATPTTAPVCGADCSQNPNLCQNISGCNYCNPTSKKCEAQPSPTPTSTPSPTPPPFDESMCSCDSLNFTPIVLGVKTKVTAYGKVLGVNKNYAKIPTFTFTWYQSPPNSAQATIKKQDKVNTTIIEDTAEKVRYQAIWDLDVPANLDTTQTYRIQAHPDCSRKAAFYAPTTTVAGASTSKQLSFWDRIASFFAGIFNVAGGGTPQAVGPTATPTLTPHEKSLQLKTFKPVNVSTGIDAKNCTFIKFSF